jgi:hypothetical protein
MTEFPPDLTESAADHDESPTIAAGFDLEPPPVRIHGNSAPMRAVKRLRAELMAHLGSSPSPVQMAMMEQAAEIKLRLSVMDQTFRQTGRRSAHATRDYLAWSNSFTRLLRQFGLNARTTPGPTLAEILATAPPARARTVQAPLPVQSATAPPQPASAPSEAAA